MIVINEVFPAPSQSSEWIELYNTAAETIVLTNWQVFDQLSSPSMIYEFGDEEIAPQDYLVIQLLAAKLNNSADGVTLIDHQAEIIDQMSYSSSQSDLSWSKTPSGKFSLTLPTSGETNLFPSPTPNLTPSPSPNSTPSPNLDSTWHHLIQISDFMACPSTNEDEWVELFNDDHQVHALSGWKIRDASGQSRKIELVLPAKNQAQVSWSSSLLNNNGDTIFLENDQGKIIQSIEYRDCKKLDHNVIEPESEPDDNQTLPSEDDQEPSPQPPLSFPIKPKPLHSLSDISLGENFNQTSSPSALNIVSREPERLPILSVILGGSLLLFVGGWKIYEALVKNNFIS